MLRIRFPLRLRSGRGLLPRLGKDDGIEKQHKAVSYTHLDVYKRQIGMKDVEADNKVHKCKGRFKAETPNGA